MENRSKFFVRLVIYPLTLYSAFRNFQLIQSTLGDDLSSFVAGLFALFALDAGVLIWTEIAFRIDSDTQDKIAKGMVFICLVGALLGVVADTMLYVDRAAFIGTIKIVSVYAVPFVIFLNLGAGFAYMLVDPENAIRAEERRLDREARKKERLAELQQAAARREADAARIQLDTTAIRNATTAAMLGITQPLPSQNGSDGKPAMAPMNSEGPEVPKARRRNS